jgi:hypothetical protein
MAEKTPETRAAEERDAEYVKTLISTVGLVAGVIASVMLVAARLLMP